MTKDNSVNDNQEIVPRARVSAHRAILNWFLDREKTGLILDAPAGFGHLSMRLKEMGFDVVCGEIDTKIFKLKDVKCIYTDLKRL